MKKLFATCLLGIVSFASCFAQYPDSDMERIESLTEKTNYYLNLGRSSADEQQGLIYYRKAVEYMEELLNLLLKDPSFSDMAKQWREQIRTTKQLIASGGGGNAPNSQYTQPGGSKYSGGSNGASSNTQFNVSGGTNAQSQSQTQSQSGSTPANLDADIERINQMKASKGQTQAGQATNGSPAKTAKSEEELKKEYEAQKYERSMQMMGERNKLQESMSLKSSLASSKGGPTSCMPGEDLVHVGSLPVDPAALCKWSVNEKGHWSQWLNIGRNIQISYCPRLMKPVNLGDRIVSTAFDYGYYRFRNLNGQDLIVTGHLKITYADENGDTQETTEILYFDSGENDPIREEMGMYYMGFEIESVQWTDVKCYIKSK